MGDPAILLESVTSPVVTAIPTLIAGVTQEATKTSSANKNGKKADSGSSSSFFTWFIVLALLGVWTSVAVVYFDLVDYQGVLGKLVAYDTDGDGDFDVEDAKVLLDEKAGGAAAGAGSERESYPTKDVGRKLREALKQQLTIIHERVEAKKIAKLALAEVRQLLAKEEEEEKLVLGRDKIRTRVNERVATRLQEEEENMEKEEMKKALEKLRKEKAKQVDEEKSESNGEVKKAQDEDKLRGRENAKDKRKGSKAEKSARKARNEER